MGTYSHNTDLDERDLMRLTPNPPTPSRGCTGETYIAPNHWSRREAGWDKCRSGALAFVPEVAYCAHHMPADWLLIAQQRKLLWARMLVDVWRDILAEYPGPNQ